MIKPKRKIRLKKSQAIIFFLTLCLITGLSAGVFSVYTMSEHSALRTAESITNYINRINAGETSVTYIVFLNRLFSHGKTAILIWALAFIKFGGLIILPVFMLTGIRYGYSTALLLEVFGLEGMTYAALLYLPQALLLLPCYFMLSYYGIDFSLTLTGKDKRSTSSPSYIKDYILKLLIGLLIAILASGVDVFMLSFAEGRL